MTRNLFITFSLFLPIFAQTTRQPETAVPLESREQRELNVAAYAFMLSRAVAHSPDELACPGVDWEVPLALIGARSTKASLKSLAGLVRFSMDAGLSTDYECYVWEKGK